MVSCGDGTSQWITSPASRALGHKERSRSQAIIVGTGTALADDPKLTVRIDGITRQPLRVLLDTAGKVRKGHILDTSLAPTLVVTNLDRVDPNATRIWREKGCSVRMSAYRAMASEPH